MNSNPMHTTYSGMESGRTSDNGNLHSGSASTTGYASNSVSGTNRLSNLDSQYSTPAAAAPAPAKDNSSKLADDLQKFQVVAQGIRANFKPVEDFNARCQQAFDLANDLFGNAPTWVCFYRELMGG